MIGPLTSVEVMHRLIQAGYETMMLGGIWLDQFGDGVLLFVDDDARHLLDGYFELEDLAAAEQSFQHGICFNDGVLCLTATCESQKVEIDFRFCPTLDAQLLVNRSMTVTREEYLWWWRGLAATLVTFAEQGNSAAQLV